MPWGRGLLDECLGNLATADDRRSPYPLNQVMSTKNECGHNFTNQHTYQPVKTVRKQRLQTLASHY